MTYLWTAFLLGLAGSLHCAGMCSPLVMAVTGAPSALARRLQYNAGRILVYGFFGGMAAWLGSMFSWTAYRGILSVATGVVLIIFALAGITNLKVPVVTPAIQKLTILLKRYFGWFLLRKSWYARTAMGALNGMLPCGLTYLALTYCLILPAPVDGALFMLVFGIGTLGVMLGFPSLVGWMARRFRFNFGRMATVLLMVAGVTLIGRAFIEHSPSAVRDHAAVTICP